MNATAHGRFDCEIFNTAVKHVTVTPPCPF